MAGGAAALGSLGTSRASAREQGIEKEELHGRKRGQVLRAANTSEKVGFVAGALGTRGDVDSVFAYTLDDGASGYGVTYGAGDEAEGPTIRYYQSDSFESGEAVSGGKPSGDGSMGVVADGEVIIETAGTERVNEAMNAIQNNNEYEAFKQRLDGVSLKEDAMALAHTDSGTEEPTDILIPIVKNGEAVDRLVLSGPSWPSSTNIQEYRSKHRVMNHRCCSKMHPAVRSVPSSVLVAMVRVSEHACTTRSRHRLHSTVQRSVPRLSAVLASRSAEITPESAGRGLSPLASLVVVSAPSHGDGPFMHRTYRS